MAWYEMVREIQNECSRNQMRDVFFEEVETDDPEAYVNAMISDKNREIVVEKGSNGSVTIYVSASGLNQKFLFTKYE